MSEADKYAELKAAVAHLRRVRSPQADVMRVCDLVDELIGTAEARRARPHPLWKRDPPDDPTR